MTTFIAQAFGVVGLFIVNILGLVLYVWTIVVAFLAGGLVAAIISMFVPVLAQIFWAIRIWNATGTPWNPYCMACMAWLGGVALCLASVLVAHLENGDT